ncbi:MAG: GAF domain-containing protein [Candidatus Hodarchaeales archaeon]
MEKAVMDKKIKENTYNNVIINLKDSFESHDHENPQDVYGVIVGELSNIPYISWAGIYLVSGHELILNCYKGDKTQYTRIQIGRGICGSALAEMTDIIIDDVTKESNYLVRSLDTLSEMVVLIIFDEHIIGLIDVESEIEGAFNEIDKEYVKEFIEIMIQQLRALGPK